MAKILFSFVGEVVGWWVIWVSVFSSVDSLMWWMASASIMFWYEPRIRHEFCWLGGPFLIFISQKIPPIFFSYFSWTWVSSVFRVVLFRKSEYVSNYCSSWIFSLLPTSLSVFSWVWIHPIIEATYQHIVSSNQLHWKTFWLHQRDLAAGGGVPKRLDRGIEFFILRASIGRYETTFHTSTPHTSKSDI